MTGIPGHLIMPLFPLPNMLLFPGCVVPLHIFEPRYRQMVGDLLDGPGRMVMGNLIAEPDPFERCAGAEKAPAQPPVYSVAGLGEIVHHEREPDGRFLIWLLGQSRVRIQEVSSERMYRLVDVEILHEVDVPEPRASTLRECLHRAILSRCDQFLNLPANMPLSALADLLSQRIPLPGTVRQQLYEELDVGERALAALREHELRPKLPPPDPKEFLA